MNKAHIKAQEYYGIFHLLITALSSISLNTLGLALPCCGNGVTLPISTKPNPVFNIPSTASPCLSKPAAKPMGFGNGSPNTIVSWMEIQKQSLSVKKTKK